MTRWRYSLPELAPIIGSEPPEAGGECSGVSTDTRTLERGDIFFALAGERYDAHDFITQAADRGAVAAVTARPVDGLPCLVVNDVLTALQAFAAHHRQAFNIPVIAITGSCGKTSSKDMIGSVLSSRYEVVKTQGNLNNEIGCPLSLLRLHAGVAHAVIEMGANHRGEIRRLCAIARPTESAITMIAPAHIEGFGSIEGVAAAKAEIVEGLPPGGVFYLNTDDPRCVAIASRFDGTVVRYGSEGDVRLVSATPLGREGMHILVDPVGEMRLPVYARGHLSNVLLAIAVGIRHGITDFEGPLSESAATMTRFVVHSIDGIDVIDDTYNANPASMRVALDALAGWPARGSRIAALGDMLEMGPDSPEFHRELGAYAASVGIDALYLRGDFAGHVAAAAKQGGLKTRVIQDHAEMAEALFRDAAPGDVLLLKGSRGMKMEQILDHAVPAGTHDASSVS